MNKQIIYFLILSTLPILSMAQIPNSIELESHQLEIDGETLGINSSLSINTAEIIWTQHGIEDIVNSFSINSISGTWEQTTNSGKLTFSISFEGQNGHFILEKVNGELIANLDVPEQIKIIINNIQY